VDSRGRLLVDGRGEPRTAVILCLVVAALVVFAVGTFAALLAAGAGSPETLAIWVVAALLVVKVPLLLMVWWLITRRRDPVEGGGWSSGECGEILGYIEEQARASVGREDAAARLAYFSREAWFVADGATDADKAAAVAAALRVDALAASAGARSGPDRVGPASGPDAG
jgi:hypothetical protein